MKIAKFDDTRVLGAMDAGEHSIESLSFSPDIRSVVVVVVVVVASMGGVATIWSTMGFTVRHTLQHSAGVIAVKWHRSVGR
jgi:hypothetical protein